MLILSNWTIWMLAGYIAFAFVLLLILIEDFRFRGVRWWYFLLAALLAAGVEFSYFRIEDVIINTCFTLIQVAMLSLYFSIKERRLVNITRQYLGWGDILFWLVLCLLFSPLNFVLFFMVSMLFVSMIVAGWKLSGIKPAMTTVPLAGIQALAVLILMAVANLTQTISFRNDSWIEKWLSV